ncbi:ATP-dependent RNA helicase Mak5p [Diutina catenulata]
MAAEKRQKQPQGNKSKKLKPANGTKKNGGKSGGQKKAMKPPTLKQKHRKEGKIVKADNLKWKAVEIPDNFDDFSGCFGLEELEGVSVRYVNGKAELVAKDEDVIADSEDGKDSDSKGDNKKKAKTEAKAGNDKPKPPKTSKEAQSAANETIDESDINSDIDVDEEEFTGFDDEDDSNDIADLKGEGNMEDTDEDAEQTKGANDDNLLTGTFTQVSLPDDVSLPEWASMNLSSYTEAGIAKQGFNKPTLIQKLTIPLALDVKDVIGKATTGSGKTLAFGIPILEKFLHRKEGDDAPTAIIFAPTRELAHQVVKHLENLSTFSPLANHGIVSITGGLSIQKQQRLLKHNPGVIVATPGRFLELLKTESTLTNRMSRTSMLVLDEADRLLQDGHFEEFEEIMDLFKKEKTKKWQTMVFSATFARDLFMKLDKSGKSNKLMGNTMKTDEIIALLGKKLSFRNTPEFLDANPKERVSSKVTEALIECGATERDLYLYYFLLMYPGTSLVFANSIDSVKRLLPFLRNLEVSSFAIHSGMEQKQRLRSLEKFQAAIAAGESSVLVATDVAARGLDIPNINHVVHYHLPKSADVYIHRSGRTARAGKEGVALMLCSPEEASGPLKKLRKVVEESANTKKTTADVTLLPIEYDVLGQLMPRTKLAAKLADNDVSTSQTAKESSWVMQAAEDLGLDDLSDLDEDDILKRQRRRKENKLLDKNEAKGMRAELRHLLKVPLRKNVRRSYITSGMTNLAHQMVHGMHHEKVLGHESSDALTDLKSKTKVKAVTAKNEPVNEKSAKKGHNGAKPSKVKRNAVKGKKKN